MVDNDDHNEDEDEVVVHSSVVDDHSHTVQVEESGHYILVVERDVVVASDRKMVDAYRVDNFLVDRNKAVHVDYHMEDIVADVVASDNVKRVDEVPVASSVDLDTRVVEEEDEEDEEDEHPCEALVFVD